MVQKRSLATPPVFKPQRITRPDHPYPNESTKSGAVPTACLRRWNGDPRRGPHTRQSSVGPGKPTATALASTRVVNLHAIYRCQREFPRRRRPRRCSVGSLRRGSSRDGRALTSFRRPNRTCQ